MLSSQQKTSNMSIIEIDEKTIKRNHSNTSNKNILEPDIESTKNI